MIFSDYGIFGYDVAFYQADPRKGQYIDFQKMKGSGASFVVIKCGQWNFKDPAFDVNWQASKAVNLTRMSYWFEDYRDTGKQQAIRYWAYLGGDVGQMLWIDFETGAGTWREVYDMIYELQVLSNLPNERIGIYTGYYYWFDYGPKTPEEKNRFAKHPLWLAGYDPVAMVKVPPAWTECLFWQSGTPPIGAQAGVVSKEIDYDKFNGDGIKYRKLFGTVNPPPPGGTMYIEVKSNVTTETRTIRDKPGIHGTGFSSLPVNGLARSHGDAGDIFTYTADVPDSTIPSGFSAKAGDQWIRIYEVNGAAVSTTRESWLAVKHLGKVYTLLTTIGPPPIVEGLQATITLSSPGYVSQSTTLILPPV